MAQLLKLSFEVAGKYSSSLVSLFVPYFMEAFEIVVWEDDKKVCDGHLMDNTLGATVLAVFYSYRGRFTEDSSFLIDKKKIYIIQICLVSEHRELFFFFRIWFRTICFFYISFTSSFFCILFSAA